MKEDERVTISGKFIKKGRIKSEGLKLLENPEIVIQALKVNKSAVDIFTFSQELPEIEPKYSYYQEWEELAVLPITTYDNWYKNQIRFRVRNKIKKAKKMRVDVKNVILNDDLVTGISKIYNESPIRQGRPFKHYKKEVSVVKKENSTFLESSVLLGAFYEGELIGYLKFVDVEKKYANIMQIISMIKHRDKAPTNALIAKAVEVCSERGIPYLIYTVWSRGSMGDFKESNGFIKTPRPRYYIPLSLKGKLFIHLRLHNGVSVLLPEKFILYLIKLRTKWYTKNFMSNKLSGYSDE